MTLSAAKSYSLHQLRESSEATEQRYPSAVTAVESIDNLRHVRMIGMLAGVLAGNDPSGTWVTIGDGHFGSDAIRLKTYGVAVHATSLTDSTLRASRDHGWIDGYSSQNAEDIQLDDEAYDYVLCKESYHHFPRPPIALYEMLRVARKAVVLIEPSRRRWTPLGFLRTLVKRCTGRELMDEYEPSGNYVYRLSFGEMIELARAFDLPVVAYRFFNDFYHPRLFRDTRARWRERFLFRLGVGIQDLLCRAGLMPFGGISCALFKADLPEAEVERLRRLGITVCRLGRNPYLAT